MKKIITCFLFGLIVIIGLSFQVGRYSKKAENTGGSAYQSVPSFVVASSTWYTLNTTSVRILASSTPTKRVAATIQPINCAPGVIGAFLNTQSDVAAAQNQGLFAAASSTLTLVDYPNLPVVQGAVRAIASGVCTVLVTEWRTQY